MEYRTVKLIYPHKSNIRISTSKVPSKTETIYETVDFFEKNIFLNVDYMEETVNEEIELKNIVNLHNGDGIKEPAQIISMIKQIKSGKDILSTCGLPNIKLVKTKNNELVLFDGHHSMLAYMAAGKAYLNQVPYLIVNGENGYVEDNEIHIFFGKHSKKLKDADWRKYVINWQAEEEKQLCKRIQKNLGELLDSMSLDNESLARR